MDASGTRTAAVFYDFTIDIPTDANDADDDACTFAGTASYLANADCTHCIGGVGEWSEQKPSGILKATPLSGAFTKFASEDGTWHVILSMMIPYNADGFDRQGLPDAHAAGIFSGIFDGSGLSVAFSEYGLVSNLPFGEVFAQKLTRVSAASSPLACPVINIMGGWQSAPFDEYTISSAAAPSYQPAYAAPLYPHVKRVTDSSLNIAWRDDECVFSGTLGAGLGTNMVTPMIGLHLPTSFHADVVILEVPQNRTGATIFGNVLAPTAQPIIELSYMAQEASAYLLSRTTLRHESAPAGDSVSTRCTSMLGRWVGKPHSSIRATLDVEGSGIQQLATAYSAHDLQIVWQEGCLFAGYNSWARADGSLSSTEMITGELSGDGNDQRLTILELAEAGASYVGFIQGNMVDNLLYISYVGALPGAALAFDAEFSRAD